MGLTADEKDIVVRLGQVWNQFLLLRDEHADDVPEFRRGIHQLQEKVLARAARREMNGKEPTK